VNFRIQVLKARQQNFFCGESLSAGRPLLEKICCLAFAENMFVFLNILWLFRTSKYVLFWLYLWQLKEYHIGRFIDHFKTNKGKKILFDYFQILKVILLIFLLIDKSFFIYLFFVLFLVYLIEVILFFWKIVKKSAKKPMITSKTLFLIVSCFIILFIFLFWIFEFKNESQFLWLILFDILVPVIISFVVILFQPFFVLIRNYILGKARQKLQKIKSFSGLKVIAITGSYGKTSTKEFLATILSRKYKVLSTKEHQNSEIGVAKCILNGLKPSHQIFIAEVGAYNKGKVKQVCKMLAPDIGVVTGVNEQHMALFGSMKNLLSAEGGEELAESLPKNGLLIVNGDNRHCLELLKKNNNLSPEREKIYSINNKSINSDIWAEEIEIGKDSAFFVAANKDKNIAHFQANVLGRQNVQNLLCAILTANELGMNFDEILEAVKQIKPEQAGMVVKQGKYGINIIDSSYSANPDGVLADLDYLSLFENKKVVVMPCLIELGPKSSEIHQKIGKKIAEVCDLAIITTKDKFKYIKKGALEAGAGGRVIFIENPKEIFSKITTFCKSGDTVLLEGRASNSLLKILVSQ